MADEFNKMPVDETAYRAYLQALLAGDRGRCSQIAGEQIAQGLSIQDLYEDIFKRSLYEVGALWESNKISVAVEHLATAITEGLMNALYDQVVSSRRTARKAIVASVTDELHQVGGKMVADMFEMNGWDSYYLGADIPAGEMARLVRDVAPDVAGLSMSLYFHLDSLRKMVDMLSERFAGLSIIVGGQGFRHGGTRILSGRTNVVYIDSLETLDRFINAFDKTHPRKGAPH